MAIADVALIGLDRTVPATAFLAEMQRRLDARPELHVELGGMGTTIEGETSAVWKAVADMHEMLFELGLDNVYTIVKVHDYRVGGSDLTAAEKVAQVHEQLVADAQASTSA